MYKLCTCWFFLTIKHAQCFGLFFVHFARYVSCITFNYKHIVHLYFICVKRIFYFFKHFNGKLYLSCMHYWYICSIQLVCTYHTSCTLLPRNNGLSGEKNRKTKEKYPEFSIIDRCQIHPSVI